MRATRPPPQRAACRRPVPDWETGRLILLLVFAVVSLLGDGVLGVLQLRVGDELVTVIAELASFSGLALFSGLFTDGQQAGPADLAGTAGSPRVWWGGGGGHRVPRTGAP